jgi:hypothetical protein
MIQGGLEMDERRQAESDEVLPVSVTAEGRPPAPDEDLPPKGIPAVAEALGYIGGALALAAVIALLSTFWSQLGLVGHVGIGVALAVAGLVGGFAIGRVEGAAAERLSQFLLLAGVAGVGVAVGFAVRDLVFTYSRSGAASSALRSNAAEWGWFAGAAAVAVSGGLVWWRKRTVLQHLAFGAGVAATALLVLPLVPIDGPDWGAGATLIAVALVWGALALGDLIPPRTEGLVLSALGIVGGIEMMALVGTPSPRWPIWLGAAACAALIWAGSKIEQIGVLGIGTVGLMVFSGQLVGEYLGFGAGTAIALIAVGFVLLGIGVRFTLRQTPETSQNRRVATEVAGYLGVALAMGGAGILMAKYWDELGVSGHILVPLVGAAVAYTCALLLGRSESGTARRLSQTLLAIGVLSAGITGAMVAQPIVQNVARPADEGAWTMLAGGLVAAVVGGATWLSRKGSLTQVAFMGGIFVSVISVLNFPGVQDTAPDGVFGIALIVIGVMWVAFGAAERIVPARTALVLGCVVTIQGLQMLMSGGQGFNAWAGFVGIGFGIAAIVASIYLKRAILLGFGAVAIIMFSMATVMEVFGGRSSAPILLLVMGVVFIAVAVVAAKVAPRIRRTPKVPKPPQAPATQA